MSFLDRFRPPHRPGLRCSEEARRWANNHFPESHRQIAAVAAGILCEQTGALFSELHASTHFLYDMGVFDYFDPASYSTAIEHEFQLVISEQELIKIQRISDLVEFLYQKATKQEA